MAAFRRKHLVSGGEKRKRLWETQLWLCEGEDISAQTLEGTTCSISAFHPLPPVQNSPQSPWPCLAAGYNLGATWIISKPSQLGAEVSFSFLGVLVPRWEPGCKCHERAAKPTLCGSAGLAGPAPCQLCRRHLSSYRFSSQVWITASASQGLNWSWSSLSSYSVCCGVGFSSFEPECLPLIERNEVLPENFFNLSISFNERNDCVGG